MIKVAILIPLCSRNQKWDNIDEIDFIKIFLPSFHRTKEKDYRYIFYLGIDDNDTFFNRYREDLEYKLGYKDRIIILEGCNHNPARAWNILYKEAYRDNCDYFYQVGSDVQLLSPKWTSYFINVLKKHKNVGITGGVERRYWIERAIVNQLAILENVFLSRKHYEFFSSLFYPEFKNWFIDDHITRSYGKYAFICPNILYNNVNRILPSNRNDGNRRYNTDIVEKERLNKAVVEWATILKRGKIEIGPVYAT